MIVFANLRSLMRFFYIFERFNHFKLKNMKIKVLLLASLGIFLSSCVTTVYTHNPHNLAGFTEKGQSSLNASYGMSFHDGENINLNAAYAITDNLRLGANASYIIGRFHSNRLFGSEIDEEHKNVGSYIDLGLGYYRTNASQTLLFENYLGYGHASLNHTIKHPDLDNFTSFADINYHKVFNQLSVGYRNPGKYFEAYIPVRLGYLFYHDILIFESNVDNTSLHPKDKFMFSSGFVMRFGTEKYKMEFSNYYYTYSYDIEPMLFPSFYTSFGIVIFNPFDFLNKTK